MKTIDTSNINWGANGHKLLIHPKFIVYLNRLDPGPDRGLVISLFNIVHYLNIMINKTEPKRMKSSIYQPAVRIGIPIDKHKGKINTEGFKEFIRVLINKYPNIQDKKDYEMLMALTNMSKNTVGEKPIQYKLNHTAIPVSDCIIDLSNHCKIVQAIKTFAYMNHYQITFQMNTGKVGAACLDLPSKPEDSNN